MMAKTHVGFAATVAAALHYHYNLELNILNFLICVFSSLLPDIDHPKSTFGRVVPFFSHPISSIFGHRGITHSLLIVIALSYLMYLYGAQELMIFFSIAGYLSHLFADFLTNKGVPLFYPYKKRISFFVTFTTGGKAEYVFFVMTHVLTVLIILKIYAFF